MDNNDSNSTNDRLSNALQHLEESVSAKIEKAKQENNKIKSEGIKIIDEIKSDLIKIKNIIN